MTPPIGFPRSSAELIKNTSTVSPTTLATVKDVLDNLGGRTPSALPVPIAEGGTGQITALAGFDALSTVTSTAFGRALLALANQAALNALFPIVTGVWTPGLAGVANLSAASANSTPYIQISDRVIAGINLTADAVAAAGTVTQLRGVLPVSSNLGSAADLVGAGAIGSGLTTMAPIYISGDTTNDQFLLTWASPTTANAALSGIFIYRVI